VSSELHAPASSPSVKDACVSVEEQAGCASTASLDSLLMPGIQPRFIGCLDRGLVTVSTELSRLVLDVWGV
jgi:hypothetical protein